MKLEPEQIKAVCDTLRKWGHDISDNEIADLVAEFNVIKNDVDYLGVRTTDPETSRAAAKLNYPRRGSQRHKALMAIANAGSGGLTASEIEAKTDVPFRSLTPRLGELKNMRLIKCDDGKTRTGPMGAQQDVLVLTWLGAAQVRRHEG
jgi:hypothetical protein